MSSALGFKEVSSDGNFLTCDVISNRSFCGKVGEGCPAADGGRVALGLDWIGVGLGLDWGGVGLDWGGVGVGLGLDW